MLSEKAATGSISAMVALERALRPKDRGAGVDDEIGAELDRLLEEG